MYSEIEGSVGSIGDQCSTINIRYSQLGVESRVRAYTGHWSISSAVPVSGRAESPVSQRESGLSSQSAGERNLQSVIGKAGFPVGGGGLSS